VTTLSKVFREAEEVAKFKSGGTGDGVGFAGGERRGVERLWWGGREYWSSQAG